jgi:hypothetical protein
MKVNILDLFEDFRGYLNLCNTLARLSFAVMNVDARNMAVPCWENYTELGYFS